MVSSKGPWEARTIDLIKPQTSFYHKCSDVRHAGRAKLDIIGGTKSDKAFIIEVKQAPERKKTQDWLSWKEKADATTLSPLQRLELQSASVGGMRNIWVCVGIENFLYCFDFALMEDKYGRENPWPFREAYEYYSWTGPKGWKDYQWTWL